MNNNYKIFFLIFVSILFYCKTIMSSDNVILFKIKEKAYTSYDYEKRLEYLDFVGNNSNLNKEIILEDFISANLFHTYYKDQKKNVDYKNKILEIFENIRNTNQKNNKINLNIDKENLLFNIEIDYIRKIVLENILNQNLSKSILPDEEIDLVYKFKIKNISFIAKNVKKIISEINNLKSITDVNVELYLNNNNIEYFTKENEINNINKVDIRIRKNILKNKKFFIIENNNTVSLIFIKKSFETFDGIVVNLYSIRSKLEIEDNYLKCSNLLNIKNDNNIINKEYKFEDLNNQLKENLININDYVKFSNEDENIYIVLCNIKFNKEKLNATYLNKMINLNAGEYEKEFINKYSKIYNLKRNNG